MLAGADAFRINMSHGDQKTKAKLVEHIRALEKEFHRPYDDPVRPAGAEASRRSFRGRPRRARKRQPLHLRSRRQAAGNNKRVHLPHPELFESVKPGTNILIDDGKVRLNVVEVRDDQIVSEVKVGGAVSDNKGVNVPDVLVPIPALTDKDRDDLQFALDQRADWIALSFVQRPEDVAEARSLIGERAALAREDRKAGGDRPPQ